MARGRKRNNFREWLLGLFTSKGEVYHTPDGPQQPSSSITTNHYEINNSFHVSGTGHVVTRQDGQVDRSMMVTHGMSLLSQHIIRGAAHDDSARHPPPRCHPDTRVKLIARVTTWFNGQAQEELLLWITGPAGVGKSATVQTFAEYLAKNHSLGASVFISRPNGRNNPHRVFNTIAYQLSIRIEAYRNYITERLSIDPELVNREMAAQFAAFIVEPFVEKRIGVGGKRWGILLDGLDELNGEDAQCEIIQLITAFVHEHRDTPLVWIIASRPEPHMSNTFDDSTNRSHWSEYIPIDSTEACEDVDRFLRSSFETIRKKFRRCVPGDWPSDSDFLKLTVAASGLFVYAEVVMHFIRDPTEGDPASRLEILLSVIGRSTVSTADNPFVHLDALYKEILSSIPSKLWPSTKRILNYIIFGNQTPFREYLNGPLPASLQTVRGMAILVGLPLHVIYTCLLKCHSALRVPDLKASHKKSLTFLHASFADYLKDSARSGDFHVGTVEDTRNGMAVRFLDIWNECSAGTVESTWRQYCSKWDDKTPSRAIAKFHATLFPDFVNFLSIAVIYTLRTKSKDSTEYAKLQKVHMVNLCYHFKPVNLQHLVHILYQTKDEAHSTEFLRRVQLKDLKFGSLNWEELSPARAHHGKRKFVSEGWILQRPRSSAELKTFISELESLQERLPELEAVIFGGVFGNRVAAFRHVWKDEHRDNHRRQDFMYYIIPYLE